MITDALTGWMTWEEFNELVDSLCPLESKRIFGEMDGTSSVYYRKQIRQAVLDLQKFIPEYQKNHETIYFEQDVTKDGMASVGALPPMSQFESAWYYSVDRQFRYPVKQVPWEARFDMTTKEFQDTLNSQYITLTAASATALAMTTTINALKSAGRQHAGIMAISPKHDQFYCFPHIQNEWILSLFWDGVKVDWRDEEMVPYGEDTAQAVAYWVQAQFALYIERDSARAASMLQLYAGMRTNIFIQSKKKGLTK